jgi:hypothetical protein
MEIDQWAGLYFSGRKKNDEESYENLIFNVRAERPLANGLEPN